MRIKALLTFLLQRVFVLSHGQISALQLTSTERYHHQFASPYGERRGQTFYQSPRHSVSRRQPCLRPKKSNPSLFALSPLSYAVFIQELPTEVPRQNEEFRKFQRRHFYIENILNKKELNLVPRTFTLA